MKKVYKVKCKVEIEIEVETTADSESEAIENITNDLVGERISYIADNYDCDMIERTFEVTECDEQDEPY